jgi:hypothetical protein
VLRWIPTAARAVNGLVGRRRPTHRPEGHRPPGHQPRTGRGTDAARGRANAPGRGPATPATDKGGRRPPQSLGRPPAQRHADPPRRNDDGDYRGLALGRRRRRLARTLESSSTASLPHVSAPPVSGCVASRFPRPRVWAARLGRCLGRHISGGMSGRHVWAGVSGGMSWAACLGRASRPLVADARSGVATTSVFGAEPFQARAPVAFSMSRAVGLRFLLGVPGNCYRQAGAEVA